TNYAHIDQFGEIENANLHVAGWHIANYKYEYIFIMDYNTGKELARVRADGIYRPDVNQAYNTLGNVGYHVSFNMRDFPNKKVYVMMRATNGMATVFLTNFIRCRTSFRMLFRLSL
ncbi:hypothetical protein ACPTFG_13590, partial [Enterococcus faecium]